MRPRGGSRRCTELARQPASASSGGESRWEFLKAFLRARRTVGAVAPTSRGVARRIVRLAGVESAKLVAELGPGTGAITRELLEALPADGRLWAFEIYPPFVNHLRETISDGRVTILDESAEAVDDVREREALPGFDAIISAVPFSLLERERTAAVLRAAARALHPEGVFVALQYHPRYLAPMLRAQFTTLEREVYLWNLPPAMLLRARGARAEG